MRSVRQKDTDAELMLRRALWKAGLRYRLHRRVAGTRPDLCFVSRQVAVFVDGCFWHGCPQHYAAPETNTEFWREKLETNIARDQRNNRDLRKAGWTVLRYWECEVRDELGRVIREIAEAAC